MCGLIYVLIQLILDYRDIVVCPELYQSVQAGGKSVADEGVFTLELFNLLGITVLPEIPAVRSKNKSADS